MRSLFTRWPAKPISAGNSVTDAAITTSTDAIAASATP
jgi:hypothetical protein